MITIDFANFADPRVAAFFEAHLADLAPTAPAESQHALDLEGLRHPSVRVWVAFEGEVVAGTVALVDLGANQEELKSMRTEPALRGRGIASQLLRHALEDARARGVHEVALETGSMEFFSASRALYAKAGFRECPPFGSYSEDPNSVFMRLEL